jgi:hypothetical protein
MGTRFKLATAMTTAFGCFSEPPLVPGERTTSGPEATDSATGDTAADDGTSAAQSTGGSATTGSGTLDTGTDDGAMTSSSTGTTGAMGDVVVLGPLVPSENLDDGAMFPAGDGYNAHWYPSGEDNAEGRQYLGQFPTSEQYYAYMRFRLPEAVPAGSSVEGVVLEISGHDEYDWRGAYALRVWVQDTPDAAAVGGTFDYPQDGSSVVLSAESVRWPESGGLVWQQPGPNATPDLAMLVQALVDAHGGLAAGAYVQFWIGEDVLDGTGEEVGWFDSIAGDELAPRLSLGFHPP